MICGTSVPIPFLKNAETMKYNGEYNDTEVFLHFETDKGHNGIMDDTISFIYRMINQKLNSGDIFMSDKFEVTAQPAKEEIGCSAVGCQDVDVCIPITIKAFGEVGNAKTHCLGKSVISSGSDAYSGKTGEVCKFTISQRLRVEVPVIFGARAEAGDAIIDCGCTEKTGCCMECETDQKA